jgi:hypothetical protein
VREFICITLLTGAMPINQESARSPKLQKLEYRT